MIGAANWFVANGEPDLAIDFAKQALIIDEKVVWPYVIIGRAYTLKNNPSEAEKYLITGARYSSLPTLGLELALAHLRAGSYRSALVAVGSAFSLEDGKVVTNLDQRVGVEAETFDKAVVLERKSFLFSGASAISPEEDRDLMELFAFDLAVRSQQKSSGDIKAKALEFIAGDDKMRGYRRLFVADTLLQAGIEPEFSAEVAGGAVEAADDSVRFVNAGMAVMSDALFPKRIEAANRGSVIVAPTIEKKTVERIYRGKIEMLAGRAAFNREDYDSAEIRLKRAVSVLPRESAWWMSGKWLLGKISESLSKDEEALVHFGEAYRSGYRPPDFLDYIKKVFVRVNGSDSGFEEFLERETKSDDASKSILGASLLASTEPESINKDVSSKSPNNEKTGQTNNTSNGDPMVESRKVLAEDLILEFEKLPGPQIRRDSNEKPKKNEKGSIEKEEVKRDDSDKRKKDVGSEKLKAKPESVVETVSESPKSDVPNDRKEVEADDKPKAGDQTKDGSDERVNSRKEVPEKVTQAVEGSEKEVKKDESGNEDLKPSSSDGDVKIEIDPKILSGAERPRVIPDGQIKTDDESECRLVFSQESISLFADGGSFGIFVGLDNFDEPYVLRARSSNPDDIKIVHEPDIGSLEKRAFFILTSVSQNKGQFSVEFESPCGKKSVEISVY